MQHTTCAYENIMCTKVSQEQTYENLRYVIFWIYSKLLTNYSVSMVLIALLPLIILGLVLGNKKRHSCNKHHRDLLVSQSTTCLSVCLPACLPVCLSVCLSVCPVCSWPRLSTACRGVSSLSCLAVSMNGVESVWRMVLGMKSARSRRLELLRSFAPGLSFFSVPRRV